MFAVMMHVFIVSADLPEVTEMRKQTIASQKKAEEGLAMGPPNIYAFAGLLNSLVTRGSEMGAELETALATLKTDYDAMIVEDRASLVRHCQLEKLFRTDQRRLVLHLQANIVPHITAALLKIGAVKKQGRAPVGYLERDLQEWLEAIEQ